MAQNQLYPDSSGFLGALDNHTGSSPFNAHQFQIEQTLSKVGTSMPCKVVAVSNAGGVAPTGTVDVQPLVNQIDGAGNAMPHGVLHGLPYSRLAGGSNAIIMDPHVGDIGTVVFASRDISGVKATRAQANPGSRRRHDMADGVYVQSMLNGTPTQFIQFSPVGITITSPTAVTINANVTVNGTITATGDVVAGTISLEQHIHGGVQPGNATTGAPQG